VHLGGRRVEAVATVVVFSEGGKVSGVRGVVDGDDESPQGSEEGVATVERLQDRDQ
jgi:hypothetical protein